MRTAFSFSLSLCGLALSLAAVELRPTAGRTLVHVTAPQEIPAARPSGTVCLKFVCRGPVSVNTRLRFFDAEGRRVKTSFLWPSLKMPPRAEWGRDNVHMMPLGRASLPPEAKTVAVELSLSHQPEGGPEPPLFDLRAAAVDWALAPRGVKTANWFTRGEDVVFKGILPPGKTGLRARVRDAEGAALFCGDVAGATWRWRPPDVGFYTVRFAWLDAAGGEEPVVESFAACSHRSEGNLITRARFAVFPRAEQAFCVSPAPARRPDEAPPMFGFNVGTKVSQDLGEDVPFELVRLLGMSAFIRYHWFAWHEIEKAGRGRYDWSSVDAAFARAARAGYGFDRILVNAFGTPAWLTTAPEGTTAAQRPYFYAPKDMAPFHDFAKAFCARYPAMRYFELWNEPHLPGYSIFWQKSSPEQFVELLRAGYTGAKAANPDVTVVMGGVGMRYLPFYEPFVKLGGVQWFDQLDTHCGYDMSAFRAVERRYGVPQKPYWEGEWHTVLYNCSTPEIPSEELCAYRMLTNMADLMHEGNTRITGFGMCCGDHTPETAPFFAREEGIHQVMGLFRSRPYLEPRLAALALRTATDCFAGDIARRGAWAFAEDGSQRLCAFSSAAGTMAFAWSANPRQKTGAWDADFAAAVRGRRILDWTGRAVACAEMKPLRVYFVLDPDLAAAARGAPLEKLDYSAYNYKAPTTVQRGVYAPAPVWTPVTNAAALATLAAQFAADLTASNLTLRVRTGAAERATSLTCAIDVTGKGLLEDVVELRATRDGTLVKLRTPALMGDIPPEFSPANVPLTKSAAACAADGAGECWTVRLAMSDLYPFIHAPGRAVRLALRVAGEKGGVAGWGAGWDRIKKPADFGRLVPSGGGRVLADQQAVSCVFGDATLSTGAVARVRATAATRAAGFSLRASFVPGSTVRLSCEMRGVGRVEAAAWARDVQGRSCGRHNAGSLPLGNGWKPFTAVWTMPREASAGDFKVFSWRNGEAAFEVRGLRLVNE